MKHLIIVVYLISGVISLYTDPGEECQYIPEDVKYMFYNIQNPKTPIVVPSNKFDEIKNTYFNKSNPTLFLVHGGGGDTTGPLTQEVRNATVDLNKIDINIIAMDWLAFQQRQNVSSIYDCINLFGTIGANFITEMQKNHGLDLNDLTIVGHSIASRFCEQITKRLNGLIKSFMGLESCAIGRDMAQLVQCMYTDRSTGYPNGHSNFYPNGGSGQPHCNSSNWCDHWRSVTYYAESLTTNKFVANQCDNYTDYQSGHCATNPTAFMGGIYPDKNARGKYYLYTNEYPPYAKG